MQRFTKADTPSLVALEITERRTQNEQNSNPSATKKNKYFDHLPQEIKDIIFEHVCYDPAVFSRYKPYWHIKSVSEDLDSQDLELIIQVSAQFFQLCASTDFVEDAIAAYCKNTVVKVAFVPVARVSEDYKRLGVVQKESGLGRVFDCLLKKAWHLRIDEQIYYRRINENLSVLRDICPLVQSINVYYDSNVHLESNVRTEKFLLWTHGACGEALMTYEERDGWKTDFGMVVELTKTQIAALQMNTFPSDLNMLYKRLTVSRPRKDGLGLSCTISDWPAKRHLHVTLWCYVNILAASVVSQV